MPSSAVEAKKNYILLTPYVKSCAIAEAFGAHLLLPSIVGVSGGPIYSGNLTSDELNAIVVFLQSRKAS
jgi:hypothetical protein